MVEPGTYITTVWPSTKEKNLRVVFDSSVSFNDVIYQRQDLANTLISILNKFHQEPATEDDRDCIKFYWWEDGNIKTDPRIYRMTVHIFGVANFAKFTQDKQFFSDIMNIPGNFKIRSF